MKRAQVFKKTLLSAAVITALGGNVGWVSAAAQQQQSSPHIINIEKLMTDGATEADLNQVIAQINKEAKDKAQNLTRYLQGSLTDFQDGKAGLGESRKEVSTLEGKIDTKKSELKKETSSSKKEQLESEISAFDKELKTAKEKLETITKAFAEGVINKLNIDAGKQLFVLGTPKTTDAEAKGGNGQAQKSKETKPRIKPLAPVAADKPISQAASPAFDGKTYGADELLTVDPAAEPATGDAKQTKVNEVVANIGKVENDKLRELFLDKKTKTPEGQQDPVTTRSPKESVTISNVNLSRDEVREAVADKLKAATKLSEAPDAKSTITLTTKGLQFMHPQVVLQNLENSPEGESVLTDVSSIADGTDPAGSYVTAGSGTLYHKNIGDDRALDEVIADSQHIRVQNTVKSRKVVIGKEGSISGYTMATESVDDGKGGKVDKRVEKSDYVRIEAALPTDVLVKDEQGKVTGRKASSYESGSASTQHQNIIGFETITHKGGVLKSQQVGFDASGKADAREVNIEKGMHIYDARDECDDCLGLAGENVTIGKEATVKAVKTVVPDAQKPDETIEHDVLTTITATDKPRAEQKLSDDGKSWVDTGKMVSPEKTATVHGRVMADLKDFDNVVVSGTLIADKVGSPEKRIKTFSMAEGATVSRHSAKSNTIYASATTPYDIKDGQTMTKDLDGFKSFNLSGGTFQGDLTGTDADNSKADDAFKGSTVTLTSGTYQGGTVKNVKSVVIDGPVVISPKSVTLTNIGADGKAEETGLHAGDFHQRITITEKGQPLILKTLMTTTPGAKPDKVTYESPVRAHEGMDLEKGAEIRVNLNLNESEEVRNVPFIKAEKTVKVNDNIVRASIDQGNDYELTKKLYQESKKTFDSKQEDAGVSFAIVDADKIEGSFADPVTDARFIKVEGTQTGKEGERHGYSVNAKFKQQAFTDIQKEQNLSDSQVEAIAALETAALSSDSDVGKAIHERVTGSTDLRRLANESTHNEVLNGGLAQTAMAVHRKVNESISRRLDRARTGISSGDMFESQGFWVQYFYNDGKLDNQGDVLGFNSKINGFTLGVDADVNSDLTAGFAFSYANSKLSTNDVSGETKTDTYMGSVYSGWHRGPYFVDGMLSYAGGRNDIERGSGANNYKGDGVKSSVWGARVVGGYAWQMNQWTLQPQAEFNYASFKLDEFTEKGNAEIQQVKLKDFDVMELGAGLKAFGEFGAGRGILRPEASLMAFHDFKDGKPEGSYKYAAGRDSVWHTLSGKNREQNRYALGLGASYAMDNNLSLGLNYDYNWSGDYKAHGFMARVSYEF